MSQTIEVKVPDIGDFKDIAIIEVAVKTGDLVGKEQSLITLETDKAAMEVPCPASGMVKEMKVKVGDKVSEGSVILLLEDAGSGMQDTATQSQESGAGIQDATTQSQESGARIQDAATPQSGIRNPESCILCQRRHSY